MDSEDSSFLAPLPLSWRALNHVYLSCLCHHVFPLPSSCLPVDCHPVVHCRPLFTVDPVFLHFCFVQSCLRALPLSRPLRLSPESVLVAVARVPIRAILALCSLMTPLTCQLNQLTD